MLLDHEEFLKEKLFRKRTKIKSVEAEFDEFKNIG